jgi:hypothetical protein
MTHQERELTKSRHSFRRSHVQAPLRESKEDLLEIGGLSAEPLTGQHGEILKVAFLHDTTFAQEKETITDLRRGGDLVDREEEGAIGRKVPAERYNSVSALPQIESFEWLIDQ